MTNEEAMDFLEKCRYWFMSYISEEDKWNEALDMAIEAMQAKTYGDLISRQDALKPFCIAPDGTRIPEVDCDNFPVEFDVKFIKKHLLSLPSAEPKTKCVAQIKIDRDDMEDLVNEKVNEIVDKMSDPKTDGVFVKGGLTISGEPPMPEGCMDCKLQNRCLCIPPDLSTDEISELYISRRPNCPLSMVAEPKTGKWIKVIDQETPNVVKLHYECDQCGAGRFEKGQQYCSGCGSMMNRGEEE